MANAVRIDIDAFRRGVEDVMTLAPLRYALRSGAKVFFHGTEDRRPSKSGKTAAVSRADDNGKHTSRK